jgi:hypothetical protein
MCRWQKNSKTRFTSNENIKNVPKKILAIVIIIQEPLGDSTNGYIEFNLATMLYGCFMQKRRKGKPCHMNVVFNNNFFLETLPYGCY